MSSSHAFSPPSGQLVDSDSMAAGAATSVEAGTTTIWVFGYGSLCWNPGFTFTNSCFGYVKGYTRKFWQGSASHRGTETQPGRVVTIIKDDDKAIVWGRAFEVVADSTAMPYLQKRECSYGGYVSSMVLFHPNGDESAPPLKVLTYIADPRNRWWLGEAPLEDICMQIVQCKGASGHNVEYVLRLAEYMRAHIPAEKDPELFRLEDLVRQQLRHQRVNVNELMGLAHRRHRTIHCHGHEHKIEPNSLSQITATAAVVAAVDQGSDSSHTLRSHFSFSGNDDFTNRLPDKKLRCVNI